MQKQPYIYTMPEGFLHDSSVGVKWKIYAIVNGFWISGKTCYAANKFFAEKLGVSERQIRNGFEQLEKEGYLIREIRGNIRIALPKGQVVEEEVSLPRGGSQSSAEAEVRLPHISDSISDSNTSVAFAPRFGGEDSPPEKKKPTTGNYTKKYRELCDWMETLTGVKFVDRRGQYKALKLAREASISTERLKARAEEFQNSGKYEKDGMDWFTVVYSFNKRA